MLFSMSCCERERSRQAIMLENGCQTFMLSEPGRKKRTDVEEEKKIVST